jgi:hypothetical protein
MARGAQRRGLFASVRRLHEGHEIVHLLNLADRLLFGIRRVRATRCHDTVNVRPLAHAPDARSDITAGGNALDVRGAIVRLFSCLIGVRI